MNLSIEYRTLLNFLWGLVLMSLVLIILVLFPLPKIPWDYPTENFFIKNPLGWMCLKHHFFLPDMNGPG